MIYRNGDYHKFSYIWVPTLREWCCKVCCGSLPITKGD